MNIKMLILFIILNFGALAIGAFLMGGETTGEWYKGVNKAPWTPPGWVFGAAWFTIMALFSIYMWKMGNTFDKSQLTTLYVVFGIQWILNVMWNPVFFKWHLVLLGLIVIALLTLVVLWLMIKGFQNKTYLGFLVAPYFIWLCIATSLNAYILLKN